MDDAYADFLPLHIGALNTFINLFHILRWKSVICFNALYQKLVPYTQKPCVTLAMVPILLWVTLTSKTFFSALGPFHHSKRKF